MSEKYPHLVIDNEHLSNNAIESDVEQYYSNDEKKEELRKILRNLRSLPWERVGAHYDNSYYFAHELIVARSIFPSFADDVTRHIISVFSGNE